MTTYHGLGLRRTIDGRKQGRRFKAVSANETQRVRTDCFVRLQRVSVKDYCDLIKPLCHLDTYNRRSGSLKAHFNINFATTVSYLAAKTSQWSRRSYQKMQRRKEIVQKTCVANWKATLCTRCEQRRKVLEPKVCVESSKAALCARGAQRRKVSEQKTCVGA